jgi:hypothetical protein
MGPIVETGGDREGAAGGFAMVACADAARRFGGVPAAVLCSRPRG